nr:MAG TPA: hypothetical protein [Caudoviricetes sp.]
MPLPFLSRSCYTSIEGLGNPRHLCPNRHNKRYSGIQVDAHR